MFVFLFLFAFLNQASASSQALPVRKITSFNFPSFTPSSCSDGNLTCMGSVTSGDGYLSLTSEPQPGYSTLQLNQVGRVIYKYSVPAWPAIIQTQFTFRIITSPNSTESADGLSFIMAPNNSPSPPASYGSYLGIMDPTQDGHAAGQLAVEFDTYKNTDDLDGNHVAVDTKSVRNPIRVRRLNNRSIDLKSGKDIKVTIILDSRTNFLRIYVRYASERRREIFLIVPIDISNTLPSSIYVGFTGSTGSLTARHQLLSWRLLSYPISK